MFFPISDIVLISIDFVSWEPCLPEFYDIIDFNEIYEITWIKFVCLVFGLFYNIAQEGFEFVIEMDNLHEMS